MSPYIGTFLKGVLIPNLLNDLLSSYCLINFDFLLLRIARFYEKIALLILAFIFFWILHSVFFFCTSNNMITFLYIFCLSVSLLWLSRILTPSFSIFYISALFLINANALGLISTCVSALNIMFL